jgi:hypothetical protein
MEKWADVPGYEGIYQVSTLGKIIRLVGKGCREQRSLKMGVHENGYYKVVLCKESVKENEFVHRIVAKAFVICSNLEYNIVNHIDGNKTNNGMDNLEWCTQKMNMEHYSRLKKNAERR